MSVFHQKKLLSIQEKKKQLQEEEEKAEQILGTYLLKFLKSQNALALDMNTLIGGLSSVIERINKGDPEIDNWTKKGHQFLKKKTKN